jgi:hypothetical protein
LSVSDRVIAFIIAFLITVFETSGVEVLATMFATVATVCLVIMGFIWTEKRFVRGSSVAMIGSVWTEKRLAWGRGVADTKMKIKHAGSLTWNRWISRSPIGKPTRPTRIPYIRDSTIEQSL